MSKLQKELVKKIILFFISIIGIAIFIYLCSKNYMIIIFTLYLGIIVSILYVLYKIISFTIKELIKDYKMRGFLTKEEYEYYTFWNDYHHICNITDDIEEELDRIEAVIKDNLIKY